MSMQYVEKPVQAGQAAQTTAQSAQPCGCDPGAGYTCLQHVEFVQAGDTKVRVLRGPGPTPEMSYTPLFEPMPVIRSFDSGANRDVDTSKYDYEGFLNPLALQAFGAYMHKHRRIADGSLRASDNWQKGIPQDVYMKSLVRHTVDLWAEHRGYAANSQACPPIGDKRELCCAIIFNAMGYLKELLDPAEINLDKA